MNNVFHEGECYIQEIMGVRKDSDSLASMIQKQIPQIAKEFLESLNFIVVTLKIEQKDIHSSIVYNLNSFIKVLNKQEIEIDLNNSTYITKEFINKGSISIGLLGLDFKEKMRIRVNGKGRIEKNRLTISIDEIYSNCPKYIKKRVLKGKNNIQKNKELNIYTNIDNKVKKIIDNTDTFFLATAHKEKGADISHKGGKKGFLKITSSKTLEFEDKPGNNLYNSLGNIHTNPYISLILIDFEKHNTLQIKGVAKIIGTKKDLKTILTIQIECLSITLEENSFLLRYEN